MASRDVIQVAIDFTTRGQGQLKQAQASVSGLTKNLGSALMPALGAATAGFAAVGAAAYGTWQALEAGAALETTRTQFENLTESIGGTSDALLTDMKSATKGMISDAELMASAGEIISLGLADSTEGVTRMATAVGALGLDMQVLGLTLANDSTARLDSLGLSMEDVRQKMQELQAQGFVGDAFDEAVLIALEERMLLLGDASETTAGKMAQLEAMMQNVKNSGFESFTTAVADGLTEVTGNATDAETALVQMGESGGNALGNLVVGVYETGNAISDMINRLDAFTMRGSQNLANVIRPLQESRPDSPIGRYSSYLDRQLLNNLPMSAASTEIGPLSVDAQAAMTKNTTAVEELNTTMASVAGDPYFSDPGASTVGIEALQAIAAGQSATTTQTPIFRGGGGGGTTRTSIIDMDVEVEEQREILQEFITWAEGQTIKIEVELTGVGGESLEDAITAIGGST